MSSLVPRRRPGTGLSEGGLLPAVFPKHRDAEDRLFDTFDTLNSVFNSKGFHFLELETSSPPDWGASPSRELRIYFIGAFHAICALCFLGSHRKKFRCMTSYIHIHLHSKLFTHK